MAACLATERLPPGHRRACVLPRQQAFGFGHERLVARARLGQQGAHLMPLPARSHRPGESLSQAGGLRAVPHQRRERSPLFFDRNQLREHIVAVERFHAHAERVARGDGFGAQAREFGGFARFAVARRRSTSSTAATAASNRSRVRGVGDVLDGPRVGQAREFRARGRGFVTPTSAFDRVAECGLAAAPLFFGGDAARLPRLRLPG